MHMWVYICMYVYVKRMQNAWMRVLYVKINKASALLQQQKPLFIFLYAHRCVRVCVYKVRYKSEINTRTHERGSLRYSTLLYTLLLFCWIKRASDEKLSSVSVFSIQCFAECHSERIAARDFAPVAVVYKLCTHIYSFPTTKITEQPYTHPAHYIELKVPRINKYKTQ